MTMESRAFGSSGLRVSALGFGAGQVGGDEIDDREAERLLNGALDLQAGDLGIEYRHALPLDLQIACPHCFCLSGILSGFVS